MAGIHNALIGAVQAYTVFSTAVGGGGGGGAGWYESSLLSYTAGGGGGAGVVAQFSILLSPGVVVAVQVGAGGVGGDPSTYSAALQGTETIAFTTLLTAALGYAGGNGADALNPAIPLSVGGGGGGGAGGSGTSAGASSFGVGGNGGDGYIGDEAGYPGGGGGGGGSASNGEESAFIYPSGGNGGDPSAGTTGFWGRGGGGGGGGDSTTFTGPNPGGNQSYANIGGWYDPSGSLSQSGGNGSEPGDGGGGGSSSAIGDGFGGNGAAGACTLYYPGAQRGTGGDSVFTTGGFTYHVFTTSGTFTA